MALAWWCRWGPFLCLDEWMDGSDVVGATQIIATLLVFLAVERRVNVVPEPDPEKRSRRITLDSAGLAVMTLGIFIGGIHIFFTSGPPSEFTRWALAASFGASVMMTLVSIGRAWKMLERISYHQEREDRESNRHQDPPDDVPD